MEEGGRVDKRRRREEKGEGCFWDTYFRFIAVGNECGSKQLIGRMNEVVHLSNVSFEGGTG